ncbi:MAG: transcriptional regulator [Cyanobacteria bacterium HKST-UBA02]|nr:transcriptional regulator [Cyanobacteria bacterium HKST-UBA02]
MALTRDFKETVVERIERDPSFAKALLDESVSLFLKGDPEAARLILRDLVNATIGFEELAIKTDMPAKSLHRMLSKTGNPGMNNFSAILWSIQEYLGVELEISDSERLASA